MINKLSQQTDEFKKIASHSLGTYNFLVSQIHSWADNVSIRAMLQEVLQW
jgi:hypothetical protein